MSLKSKYRLRKVYMVTVLCNLFSSSFLLFFLTYCCLKEVYKISASSVRKFLRNRVYRLQKCCLKS